MREFGIGAGNVLFTDHSASLFEFAMHRLRAMRCSALFVTDLSVNVSEIGEWRESISRLKSQGAVVFWMDHHAWPNRALALARSCDIAEFGENARYCAAEIVAKEFGMSGRFVRKLLGIVHVSDFALEPRSAAEAGIVRTYGLAIAYANTFAPEKLERLLRRLAKEISEGKIASAYAAKTARIFESKSNTEIEKAISNIYETDNMAISFSSSSVFQDDLFGQLFKISGKDIVVNVDCDKAKASMRSARSDIAPLAMAMGGGGHPHAAGFRISSAYNIRSAGGRQSFVKALAQLANQKVKAMPM
ncbi:MAG: hypothetical protein ACP5T3_03150 [Candidatus Micrarchaeia archaeon]